MSTRRSLVAECIEADGVIGRMLARAGCDDLYLTGNVGAHGRAVDLFQTLAGIVRERDAKIVSMVVLGLPDEHGSGRLEVAQAFGNIDWPLMWLDEGSHNSPPIAGVELHAIVGPEVRRIRLQDRIVGSEYRDRHARYLKAVDLRPANGSHDRVRQAETVFEQIQSVVDQVDMTFDNVLRTWFYNHRILNWYAEFNKVRTDFFNEHGVFDRLVPASTGIGAHNAAGTALAAGFVAMEALSEGVERRAVASPLQCPAPAYGSSFSRAAEFGTPEYRILYVSGTASIEPGGETAHLDDVDNQMELTFDVVQAILESRDMEWSDTVRAIAYFRDAADVRHFGPFLTRRGIAGLPFLVSNCTVCRDDLLFEIEVDTMVQS